MAIASNAEIRKRPLWVPSSASNLRKLCSPSPPASLENVNRSAFSSFARIFLNFSGSASSTDLSVKNSLMSPMDFRLDRLSLLIPFHIAEAVKCAGRLRVECSIQSQAVSDRTRPGSDSSSPRYASTASIFSSMLPYILPSTHLRTSSNTRSAGFNSGLYGGWMMVASPTLRTISPR